MLLSDKYWDYIDTPARAEFLEGSTASGKTTTVAVKFIMNVAESDMKLHVIAGNTTGVIEKNIINADMGLLQIFPNLEYCGNGDKENKLPHIKFKTGSSTKIIYILGYDNASKWKNALGSQFGCVWVDECNTANIDFIREIFGRSEYFVGTLNPDAPTFPIYSEYINHARPIDKYKADVPEEIWKDLTLNNSTTQDIDVDVTFGEYANPSFESQVETVSKAKQGGIMSVEASIDELYGDTKDDDWKQEEVARLKAEQGISDMEEPALNMESDGFEVDF